ncbi:MAG: YeeE/YedE family protein [Gemmatimonadota bacterium]|nr:YeeE/YedE family protein [Gemmatimonadota bacterium]
MIQDPNPIRPLAAGEPTGVPGTPAARTAPAGERVVAATAPVGAAGSAVARRWPWLLVYFGLGIVFGVTLIKGEVVSWFRIQEMFRMQAFHLYGVFLSAFLVAMPSVQLIKRSGLRALSGDPIQLPPKELGRGHRYWIGGSLFGVGLAMTGACPGPLAALIGSGYLVMIVVFASALAGSWSYGYLRPRLPH